MITPLYLFETTNVLDFQCKPHGSITNYGRTIMMWIFQIDVSQKLLMCINGWFSKSTHICMYICMYIIKYGSIGLQRLTIKMHHKTPICTSIHNRFTCYQCQNHSNIQNTYWASSAQNLKVLNYSMNEKWFMVCTYMS